MPTFVRMGMVSVSAALRHMKEVQQYLVVQQRLGGHMDDQSNKSSRLRSAILAAALAKIELREALVQLKEEKKDHKSRLEYAAGLEIGNIELSLKYDNVMAVISDIFATISPLRHRYQHILDNPFNWSLEDMPSNRSEPHSRRLFAPLQEKYEAFEGHEGETRVAKRRRRQFMQRAVQRFEAQREQRSKNEESKEE